MDARGRGLRPLPLRAAVLGSALALVVSAGLWWTNRGDGRLHLIAPVIPGDGFLLKSPGGQVALIDGGADGSAVASWLGGELPPRPRGMESGSAWRERGGSLRPCSESSRLSTDGLRSSS